jgi:lysozyme
LNQNQYDAVICLVYNIGVHAFADSHVLSYINSGQFDLVPHAFGMWDKCHGEVCEGLINRRNNEIRLWQGEI